jgi:hypothetical protein
MRRALVERGLGRRVIWWKLLEGHEFKKNPTMTNPSLAKLASYSSRSLLHCQVISLVSVNQGSVSPCLDWLYLQVSYSVNLCLRPLKLWWNVHVKNVWNIFYWTIFLSGLIVLKAKLYNLFMIIMFIWNLYQFNANKLVNKILHSFY